MAAVSTRGRERHEGSGWNPSLFTRHAFSIPSADLHSSEAPARCAEPCPAAWEEMRGTAERRHCDHCDKAVHNLSAMAPEAAAELLEGKDPVCVRLRCSADGTVLHSMAPVRGVARPRLQLLMTPALLAAMAACRTEPELPLVVEGTPASASHAPFVAPAVPTSATPSLFVMGLRAAPDERSGSVVPVRTKPQHNTTGRGLELHGAEKRPEHPKPDWLIERDRQLPSPIPAGATGNADTNEDSSRGCLALAGVLFAH